MTIENQDSTNQPNIVLDTSVVSILFNPTDFRFGYYSEQMEGFQLLISFQTIEERWYGAFYDNWGQRRIRAMERHLDRFHVVWPNWRLTVKCAELRSETRNAGRELSQADAWIAATALTLGCPLVSDDGDFHDIANLTLIQRPR